MLGFPHPDYLLPYLSAKQLWDWQRYIRHYHVSPDRMDVFHAMQSMLTHNSNCATKDTKRLNDFMLYYDRFEGDFDPATIVASFGFGGDK